MLIFPHAPNKIGVQPVPSDTAWRIVASDGSTYTTVAALISMGKVPFPLVDAGITIQTLTMRTINANADGSPFYFSINPQVVPTGIAGQLVSGSGQQFVAPGSIWQLWVKLTAAGDTLDILAQF